MRRRTTDAEIVATLRRIADEDPKLRALAGVVADCFRPEVKAVDVDGRPHMFGIEHDDGGAYHDGECWTLDRWPLMWRVEERGAVYTLDLTGDGWDRSALVEGPQGLWTGTVTPRVPA